MRYKSLTLDDIEG